MKCGDRRLFRRLLRMFRRGVSGGSGGGKRWLALGKI